MLQRLVDTYKASVFSTEGGQEFRAVVDFLRAAGSWCDWYRDASAAQMCPLDAVLGNGVVLVPVVAGRSQWSEKAV